MPQNQCEKALGSHPHARVTCYGETTLAVRRLLEMPLDFDTALRPTPTEPIHAQVAAIPVRSRGGAAEVLLISARGRGRFTVPKGWPQTQMPSAACAEREAFEKAGVIGRAEPYSLGGFIYEEGRGRKRARYLATAFLLRVAGVCSRWPEEAECRRQWFSVEAAQRLVVNEDLAHLIDEAARLFQTSGASISNQAPQFPQ